MSEALKELLEENEVSTENDDAGKASQSNGKSTDLTANQGELLITACIDWMNGSSKKPTGLDTPHLMRLPLPVQRVFSSSSSSHYFIQLSDNSLHAMGRNDHGQLGIKNTNTQYWPVPVKIPSDACVKKIATGRSHTILLTDDNKIFVCGANNFGQIGLGEGIKASQDVTSFVPLDIGNDIIDIACGWDHSLVCTNEGELYTFGHPDYGQLGNGTNGQYIRDGSKKGPAIQFNCITRPYKVNKFVCKEANRKSTTEIKSNIRIVSVAAGKNHSLALEDWENGGSNRVFSWGFGGYGRLV